MDPRKHRSDSWSNWRQSLRFSVGPTVRSFFAPGPFIQNTLVFGRVVTGKALRSRIQEKIIHPIIIQSFALTFLSIL